jgi:hypothetical protein
LEKTTVLESVKADLVNTVFSYFAPVRAVIAEVSKAVERETTKKAPPQGE